MGSATERTLSTTAVPPREPYKRNRGRVSFPRRMTLDLDDVRLEWLKEQAWQSRANGGAAGLLRAAIDAMADDDDLLVQVIARL